MQPDPSSESATAEEHLKGVDKNLEFAAKLRNLEDGDPFVIGWAITALFYSSVHVLRAWILARHSETVSTHSEMSQFFRKFPELKKSKKYYDELKQQSQSFRYYVNEFTWSDYEEFRKVAERIKSTWKQKIVEELRRKKS